MYNQQTNNYRRGAKAAMMTIALLASATTLAHADDGKVITLGYANSPLLQAVKAGRPSMDGRAMLTSKDRKPGVRLARTDMRGIDMLAVDLAEIETTPQDLELIEAAKDAGIPIVIENAGGAKMAALFGFGVDNSAVVVEFDPKARRGKMNLADPMQMDEVPGYVQMPQPNSNFGDRVQFIQDIVRKRPFTRGARMQSPLGNCLSTSGTEVFANENCKEYEVEAPAVYFCPAKATVIPTFSGVLGSTVNFMVGPAIYSCAWGTAMVHPMWSVGLYRVTTSNGVKKYAIVRSIGGWGIVGANGFGDPRSINHDYEKFPFFSRYRITMLPTHYAGWVLDKSAPANMNSVSSVQTTTGWTVSAGGTIGVQPDGVNGGVQASVSYEENRSSSVSVSDWSVVNSSGSPNSYLTYYMSAGTGCNIGDLVTFTYNGTLNAEMTKSCGSRKKLATPPLWSMSGNKYSDPLAESVWLTAGTSVLRLNATVEAKLNDVVLGVASGLVRDTGWNTYVHDDVRTFSTGFYFDPAALTLTPPINVNPGTK